MKTQIAPPWKDYELLDSGGGRKMERFGDISVIRPEQNTPWEPRRSDWSQAAAGEFRERDGGKGEWHWVGPVPPIWELRYPLGTGEILFLLRPSEFKHLGVFPEQAVNWEYLYGKGRPGERVLNLFAHTGGASQAAALAGCEVTHIDSVYPMVGWARENGEKNRLEGIRWICEDSMTFVERERKRGRTYHRIIMDPPTYGFSKKGRQWKIERDLEPLLLNSRRLLTEGGEIILNCYSARMEEGRLLPLLGRCFPRDRVSCDKLALRDNYERLVDCGYLVRVET